MKRLPIFFAVMLLVWSGCSCKSATERASLVASDSRDDYVDLHPDCRFGDLIREGEIARGMKVEEVIAAWGMPNVYAVSKKSPAEHWIYYIRDREALLMLIYTLTFEDDTLRVWDIDQKRFTSQGIATYVEERPSTLPTGAILPDKKR